jgi:hypothetical protein
MLPPCLNPFLRHKQKVGLRPTSKTKYLSYQGHQQTHSLVAEPVHTGITGAYIFHTLHNLRDLQAGSQRPKIRT